ncbi:MAG TPA: addiction module protein [Kofleriaceae bacterium]|nr:addiction module protein [Kofleriaceae bacterium]
MAVETILQEARALSVEEREKLLDELARSLEPVDGKVLTQDEWNAAWAAELDRRIRDLESGRAKTYSHEQVMAKLWARLRRP